MIYSIVQRNTEIQNKLQIQEEKQIQRQQQEELIQRRSTLNLQSSPVRSSKSRIQMLPKIDPNDIPAESELKYRYRKEHFLGSGSFGDVFVSSRRQKFAIKAFKQQPTEQDFFEISVMKGIKSQYICELYDLYRSQDGKYNIVQEYAVYGDLLKYCKNTLKWSIPENLAKEWLASVVLGLKELHSRGIIHRDIKPDNILVFKQDEVRIADYGQAKTIGEPQSKRLYGTMNFISPEMLDGRDYDFSADIYSLGITFIYLLTREFPSKNEIQDQYWRPKINGITEEFITLLPSIVDIMFDPSIAETKVMTDYRKVYGIMTLGFSNFKPDLIKQFSEIGIGCRNCTLVLCNECFRKKIESSFLVLNDMLTHVTEISNKVDELIKDAQEELSVQEYLCPYVDPKPYIQILATAQTMIEGSYSHQKTIAQVQLLILNLKPLIIKTSHQLIENAKTFCPEINDELTLYEIVKEVKSSQNFQKQNQIYSEDEDQYSYKESLILDFELEFQEDREQYVIDFPIQRDLHENLTYPMPLKKFRTFEEFRQQIDYEICQRYSLVRSNIQGVDSDSKSIELLGEGRLFDFSTDFYATCKAILVFIQSDENQIFGFYSNKNSGRSVDEGKMYLDKNSFIFSLSYQTIHRLNDDAEYSMLATNKGLYIGGCLSTNNPDIFISSSCTEVYENTSNLGQSYSYPLGSFKKDSLEAKVYLSGKPKFKVKQIQTYYIYDNTPQ
eukprot:403357873